MVPCHFCKGRKEFTAGSWWRAIVYIRDGVMRGEQKQPAAYDLSTEQNRAKATSRVRSYAAAALPKLLAAAKQIQINIRR